jgi:subtilisin-like proprotein convertase family protein/subtilisin family serine protease
MEQLTSRLNAPRHGSGGRRAAVVMAGQLADGHEPRGECGAAHGCKHGWSKSWIGVVLFLVLLGGIGHAQSVTGPGRPDRQPVGRIVPAWVQTSAVPLVQLRSGAFFPVGELGSNLAHARALTVVPGRARVILEFEELPGQAIRNELEWMGVRLLGPLSGTTWLASVPERSTASDLDRIGVQWVGAIYEEDKVPPRILSAGIGEWAWRDDGSVDLRVRYYEDVRLEFATERLAELDAILLGRSDVFRELTVNLPAERLGRLLQEDWVRWVEEVPPPRITLNDSSRASVQANEVQSAPYELTGAGVVLGIWDAGDVETAHEDFADRLILGQSRGSADVHATHVAGTMAGSGARSEALGGDAGQWRGMAPAATVVSYDYETSVEEHEEAIQRYEVVNSQNSWGFLIARFLMNCDLYGEYSQLAPDYDAVITGSYGRPITVVFAAGNNRAGFNTNDCSAGPYRTIGPPGTAKNILTVGAIDSEDHAVALFSSWGPMADGRLKPELVAPGSQRTVDLGVTSTVPGNRYGTLQGTSMAAPVVSGAIGLLVEDYRKHYNDSDPFPCTVRALLIHTADDLSDTGGYLHPGPDYASGYGRLQVQAAVDQLREEAFLVGVVEPATTNRHELEVPSGTESIKVTLVWDDPPGLENAAIALVNDLDLVVTDPVGLRHFPWTLDPANPSAPAVRTGVDRVNVIEQVFVGAPVSPGTWQVEVVGHSIAVGPGQRYTLAYTPAGMPQKPLVLVDDVQIEDAPGMTGNGDAFTDPGETRSVRVALRHEAGPALTNLTTRLLSDTPGVEVLLSESTYPDLGAGEVAMNVVDYVYRVDKSVPCATPIEFAHVWDSGAHRRTNWFTEWVGRVEVTNETVVEFEAVDVPLPIPDRGLVSSMMDVDGVGLLTQVQVSVRIDHPWHGDLRIDLVHPDGTRVRLVEASGNSGANFGSGPCDENGQRTIFDDMATGPIQAGGAPYLGHFQPAQPLHVLAGKPIEGVWRLEVTDVAADDMGTLLCWGLALTYEESGFVCDLFNRPPVLVSDRVEVLYETPRWIRLPAMDPDGDVIEFAITDFPRHGMLSDLDVAVGRVLYTPMPGYMGLDHFAFVARDHYDTSEPATIQIEVLEPIADLRLSVESGSQPTALSEPIHTTVRFRTWAPMWLRICKFFMNCQPDSASWRCCPARELGRIQQPNYGSTWVTWMCGQSQKSAWWDRFSKQVGTPTK